MLLRAILDSSPLSLRAFAREVECSPNHLLQVAQLKKNVGSTLGARIKRYDPRFSIEEQVEAFERHRDVARQHGHAGAPA